MRKSSTGATVAIIAVLAGTSLHAQPARNTKPLKPLPDAPVIFDSTVRAPTGTQLAGPKYRVSVTPGLQRPYSMVFLPDGRLLVSERAGRIRLVANGKLDPQPLSGVPQVVSTALRGLNDLALHPKFAQNRFVYFTYYRPDPADATLAHAVLARGRFDGAHGLTDVRDLFVGDQPDAGPSALKIAFAKDGTIFMGIGYAGGPVSPEGRAGQQDAQNTASIYGKILRLNDDGSIPKDNPFVGKSGYRGEIYALGIRNAMGMAVNPQTGELWESENGPQGGDELNIIQAGKNYGWPIVSFGRAYTGETIGASGPNTADVAKAGMEQPMLIWSPSPGLSAVMFYTGDRFPEWKNSPFVGALIGAQMQRIVFNAQGLPIRRDALLADLGQRIRDIKQGPEGDIYALTDEDEGAILHLEPVP